METEQAPSNETIHATLKAHLPESEHSELWRLLHKKFAVADPAPIDLGALWKVLNTVVEKDKLTGIWVGLNRPIGWDVK